MDKDVSIVIMVNVLCCSKLYRCLRSKRSNINSLKLQTDLQAIQTLTHLHYKLAYKRSKINSLKLQTGLQAIQTLTYKRYKH